MIRRHFALFLIAGVLFAGCAPKGDESRGTDVGQVALSYRIPRLGGGSDEIAAHHGKLVLVNLWATWCPPCREELPLLEQVSRSRRSELVIIGIDQGEDPQTVTRTLRRAGVDYPVLLDHDQRYGAAFASVGLPTSILLDRNGRIRSIFEGSLSAERLRTELDRASRS